jgi:ABC-type amino acid transport substrate-binding protein
MGSRNTGEITSEMVLTGVEGLLEPKSGEEELGGYVIGAVARTSKLFYLFARENPQYVDTNTSLVMALLQQKRVDIANVEDNQTSYLAKNRLRESILFWP